MGGWSAPQAPQGGAPAEGMDPGEIVGVPLTTSEAGRTLREGGEVLSPCQPGGIMHWERGLLGLTCAFTAAIGSAWAQVTERVNLDPQGGQTTGDTYGVVIAAGGRHLGFTSISPQLVPGDTNGRYDAFVRDRVTGINSQVNVSTSGVLANRHSILSGLSADGRFVAFNTHANNLVPGVTTFEHQVYLRDLHLGTTECMSTTSWGEGGHGPSHGGVPSDDGRYVVFYSRAINLGGGVASGSTDQIFVRDRATGGIECASSDAGGAHANSDCLHPRISPDGRFVTFGSLATNLAPGTGSFVQVYLRDRQTGVLEVVSLDPGGNPAQGSSNWPSAPSADGRFVAFQSVSSNLIPGVGNGASQIFLRDRLTGTCELVSVAAGGSAGNGASSRPGLSPDGRFVVFQSAASDLVAGDTNGALDVFVRDRLLGTTMRVSVATDGTQAAGACELGWMSGVITSDGRSVVFESAAPNLVMADTNGARDLFVHDRFDGIPITPYCFGDGSGTACPCGNPGSTGHGCANSAFGLGGQLTAVGIAAVSSDSLRLHATRIVPGQPSLFLQGTTAVSGGSGLAFGDGLRCAGGSVVRLQVAMAGETGTASTTAILSSVGNVAPGSTRFYQAWYRDPVSGPCGTGRNLTNGLRIVWN